MRNQASWPRGLARGRIGYQHHEDEGLAMTSLNDTRPPRAADVAAAMLARIRRVEEENRRLRAELDALRRKR
jgi:hypothetical protein